MVTFVSALAVCLWTADFPHRSVFLLKETKIYRANLPKYTFYFVSLSICRDAVVLYSSTEWERGKKKRFYCVVYLLSSASPIFQLLYCVHICKYGLYAENYRIMEQNLCFIVDRTNKKSFLFQWFLTITSVFMVLYLYLLVFIKPKNAIYLSFYSYFIGLYLYGNW